MGQIKSETFLKIVSYSPKTKISIGLGSTILYTLILLWLYPWLGQQGSALSIVPALLIGWLFGFRRGAIAGIFINMVTWGIFFAIEQALPAANVLFKSPGFLIIIIAGGIGGAASDLLMHMHKQSQMLKNEVRRHQITAKGLRIQRDFAHAVMENLGQGLTITNTDGKFKYVNQAFAQMIGRNPKEIIQQRPFDFTASEDHRALAFAKQKRDDGQSSTYETRLKHADGHLVNAYITGVPLWSNNQFLGSAAIITDLTQQKKLIAELEAFAHTAAHDIKNPLTVIINYASMLTDKRFKKSPIETKSALEAIHRNAHMMNKIIDELLLLAKTNRQKVTLKPISMPEILTNISHRLELLIEQHKATISVPKTWPPMIGHAAWVEEMLGNYISNAIKYGGTPPNVVVGATPLEDKMIRVWVQDNGEGIAQEDQSNLFTEFTQLHKSTNDKIRGHGLGLSIVRRIAERLGGTVGVESEIGKGSTFFFTLPSSVEAENEPEVVDPYL